MRDFLPLDLQRRLYKPPHPPKGPGTSKWRYPRLMTPSQLLAHHDSFPEGRPAPAERSTRAAD